MVLKDSNKIIITQNNGDYRLMPAERIIKDMATIRNILAREILDSRGNPTVEADITLSDGAFGRASVPSGASTGIHEAVELRDNNQARYGGMGVKNAVGNIIRVIAPALHGQTFSQSTLDHAMIDLDGTKQKSKLGANAILAVSMAFAKAEAESKHVPLWKYFNTLSHGAKPSLPVPMMNILNGGKHAAGSTDIQEFMVVPTADSFAERLRIGAEVFHALGNILKEKNLSTLVGNEGGFAPPLSLNEEALSLLVQAIERAGFFAGKQVSLAIDSAASELFKNGMYRFSSENKNLTAENLMGLYARWIEQYPLVSIEDGLAEDAWEDWKELTLRIGKRVALVGDDLFVTDKERLHRGITEKAGNSILIKLNQIGTVSETVETIIMAHKHRFSAIVSHRSGETEDTTIAHLAVGLGCESIKSGAPSRGERTVKYNELLRIEESLSS